MKELDEIIARFIMPSFMHNGIDKRAEAKHQILELIKQARIDGELEYAEELLSYDGVLNDKYLMRQIMDRVERLTQLTEDK